MTRAAILAIDLGTSAVKVLLADAESGVPLAIARRSSGIERSEVPGAAEQDPAGWWRSISDATREAISASEAGFGRCEVRAISVCGHGPTLVPVRKDGTAVASALLWCDERSVDDAAALAKLLGRSGWLLGELPKARWFARERQAASSEATWFLSTWDALALRLSGVAVASFWDPARSITPRDRALLLDTSESGVDARALPPEVSPGTNLGPLLAAAANDLGLAAGIPVIAGSNDGLAAVLGAGLARTGIAVDVGGSAGGVAVAVAPEEARRMLTALPGALWSGPAPTPLGDLRVVGGAFGGTGRLVERVVEELLAGVPDASGAARADLFAAAAALPLGADGVMALPRFNVHQHFSASEDFDGYAATHRPEHLLRAAIEGGALAVAALLAPARERGLKIETLRLSGPATGAVGGPLSGSPLAPDAFPQLRADLLALPVDVLRIPEASAAGAAILAGLGSGLYATIGEALDALVHVERTYEPTPARAEQARQLLLRYASLRARVGGVDLRADARGA